MHPLPVVVEDTGDLLATLLVAAPLDGFQLSLQVPGQLLQLAGLQALQLVQRALKAFFQSGGERRLLLQHEVVHRGHRLRQRRLHGLRGQHQFGTVASVGQLAGLKAGAFGKAVERFQRECANFGTGADIGNSSADDTVCHLPLHQQGLALAVGHQAHQDEGLLTRLQLRALQQRRPVTAEVREHAVAQPVHDGMLGPQVVQLRPGVFFGTGLAGGFDGGGHAVGVGAQRVEVVVGLHLTRELTQALLQITRRSQRDDAVGIMCHPLAQRLALVQLSQRGLGVVEITAEQRRGFVNLRGAADWRRLWGGRGVARRAAEQLHQEIGFVVAGVVDDARGGLVQSGFNLFGAQAVGHETGDLLSFLVGVVDVQEGRWVTQVEVGLLVLLLQDFKNAHVALDALVHRLGEEVDDVRLVLLPITVDPPIALLEHHQRPRQIEVHQPVAEIVQVQAFAGHVRAQQHAQRIVEAAESLDQILLLRV